MLSKLTSDLPPLLRKMQEIPAIFHCAYHLSSAEILTRRKYLHTFPFFPPWCLFAFRDQFDSPSVLLSLMIVSSMKTHTAFPAISISAPAFMAQAAPSLHCSCWQLSCGHGDCCLPMHPQQPVLVFSLSLLLSWPPDSSMLERFLLLTFLSTRLPVLSA